MANQAIVPQVRPLDQSGEFYLGPFGEFTTGRDSTPETVISLEAALSEVSRPYIDREVMLALGDKVVLIYDGDLTGRPVSDTSTSYPDAAFGWMDDEVRLGYQAALVSLQSPTYGRLWLSVKQHPGDTVAMGQMRAMVQAAEATTGVGPRRRERRHLRAGLPGRQPRVGGLCAPGPRPGTRIPMVGGWRRPSGNNSGQFAP
jgi:hypothetical protein